MVIPKFSKASAAPTTDARVDAVTNFAFPSASS
jgi:hypothetical protein